METIRNRVKELKKQPITHENVYSLRDSLCDKMLHILKDEEDGCTFIRIPDTCTQEEFKELMDTILELVTVERY